MLPLQVTTEQALEALARSATAGDGDGEAEAEPLAPEDQEALRLFLQQKQAAVKRLEDDGSDEDGPGRPGTSGAAAAQEVRYFHC